MPAMEPSSDSEDRRVLKARTVGLNGFADRGLSERELAGRLRLARTATRDFIYGNSLELTHWRGAIDDYLKERSPRLYIPFFNDIIVQNEGTLHIASDTYALYARRIRLFGSGKIDCQGPTTFDCDSFEGFLPTPVTVFVASS